MSHAAAAAAAVQDLAELTGGTLISEDLGLKVEATTIAQLGRAKKVSVSKDDTIVLGGGGDPKAIADRCEQLRETIEATKSDYEKARAAGARARRVVFNERWARVRRRSSRSGSRSCRAALRCSRYTPRAPLPRAGGPSA